MMVDATQVQTVATGFLGALLLALLSSTLEGLVTRRAHGLRRRRGAWLGTAPLADGLKLLARAPAAAGAGRIAAAVAVLLPAALAVGALPAGAGLGLLAPSVPLPARLLAVAGLLASIPAVLLLYALLPSPERRQPLVSISTPLIGALASMILCMGAIIASGDAQGSLWTRSPADSPLWRHPAGVLAMLGAQVILARSLRIVLGGTGPGHLAPGLVDGGGAAVVLLQLSRPLWIGVTSALAVHLYLGLNSGPPVLAWACVGLWIFLVALLQAALSSNDADALLRLVRRWVLPLAVVDVALALLPSGTIPWI